jgi:hypothetical protein
VQTFLRSFLILHKITALTPRRKVLLSLYNLRNVASGILKPGILFFSNAIRPVHKFSEMIISRIRYSGDVLGARWDNLKISVVTFSLVSPSS